MSSKSLMERLSNYLVGTDLYNITLLTGMEARRQSVPGPVMNLLTRRRRAEPAHDPNLQVRKESVLVEWKVYSVIWNSATTQ